MDDTMVQVFRLMDTRAVSKITVEEFFKFTDAIPEPPSHDDVTRLFRKFDIDNSGDIDEQEFAQMFDELEGFLRLTRQEMLVHFERRQYQSLFELVDEDGGGTISKDEMRPLIEMLCSMLSIKTSGDIAVLYREFEDRPLNFNEFFSVIKKLVAGKSISQVARAFEEAQRRKAEVRESGVRRFAARAEQGMPRATRARSQTRVCLNCAQKELEIQALREEILKLQQGLTPRTDGRSRAATDETSIEPKLWGSLHSVENSLGIFHTFPQCLKTSLSYVRGSRVNKIAVRATEGKLDSLAMEVADVADRVHKNQHQLSSVLEVTGGHARAMMDWKIEFLKLFDSSGNLDPSGKIEDVLRIIGGFKKEKEHCVHQSDNIAWLCDSLNECRQTIADAALSGASYSTQCSKLMEDILNCENATQLLLDIITMLMFYGSEKNLSEVELHMKSASSGNAISLSSDEVRRLTDAAERDKERLGKKVIDNLNKFLDDSIYALQASAGSFLPRKRDRATQVSIGMEDSVVMMNDTIAPVPRYDTSQNEVKPIFSPRPARLREPKLELDSSPAKVEELLKKYVKQGTPLPENFQRISLPDTTCARHRFSFGTKKIDVIPVDGNENLAVIVGGGYLLFDEFCKKYCGSEALRWQRDVKRSQSPIRRDLYDNSPAPKRKLLMRAGKNLKLR